MAELSPIDPFACAKREPGVHVTLDVEGVLVLHPSWSEAQANALLDTHADVIATAMLTAGLQAVAVLADKRAGGD